MGARLRSATPGTLLCLVATALLAVVSFNTPLLKSLYFLEASFSQGQYAGTLRLGTLGYCLENGGTETCEGPTVGYSFDPNDLFGISLFDIPATVTKYLTYTLVLHFVALGAAALATIFGLLSHISSLSVWCFPTCFASIASSFSLLALIFDLVIFYIAKARIDRVSGASATIGTSVWLVLASWLLAGFGGCAYGIGRCCIGSRSRRESGDPKSTYYQNQNQPDDMRLQAIRDEQVRKKEQGLPGFQEYERTPLTGAPDGEDKYLSEEQPHSVLSSSSQARQNLRRDGSVLQGVGVGYGRRTPRNDMGYGDQAGYQYNNIQPPPNVSRRDSYTSGITAGAAGVGAGPGGVDQPNYGNNGYYDNGQQDYYDNGYNDPYQQNQQNQHQQQYDPYNQQHQYPPAQGGAMAMPTAQPGRTRSTGPHDYSDPYAAGDTSVESAYSNPGPEVQHASDPYGGYDDGLGAIGRAATSNDQGHDRHYTGGTFGYHDPSPYGQNSNTAIHVPTPQHLVTSHNSAQDLLRSPPGSDVGYAGGYQNQGYQDQAEEDRGPRPPSYGSVAGAQVHNSGSGYPNEKSRYR